MRLSPAHENSYDSSRYVLLESTKTKRLETWDNEYCVHYLVNNEWKTDIIDKYINTGFIIGRGVGFALSNEISLKFKELCQEMIEPFSSAEVMHGPKSLIENSFKLFLLGMNDKSGLTVNKDVNELKNYTNLVYEMSSNENVKSDFFYPSNKILELDSVILMSKFYPWIIRYTINKGLNPDEPRYLTKVTQTF